MFSFFLTHTLAQSQIQSVLPRIQVRPAKIPDRKDVWVFIMAGQSNMAGRGIIAAEDTLHTERILTINKEGDLIYAREPLHFYEPTLVGLDCGLSFARRLLENIPENVSILIIPTAVGGSSIGQWLGDSTYRSVKLYSNFKHQVAIGKEYGTIKGILWHQGESDAKPSLIEAYERNLTVLVSRFRDEAGNNKLPVVVGELGSYSATPDTWLRINKQLKQFVDHDPNTALVTTSDLIHKGDKIHFNSEGQRTLGRRYADAFLKMKK